MANLLSVMSQNSHWKTTRNTIFMVHIYFFGNIRRIHVLKLLKSQHRHTNTCRTEQTLTKAKTNCSLLIVKQWIHFVTWKRCAIICGPRLSAGGLAVVVNNEKALQLDVFPADLPQDLSKNSLDLSKIPPGVSRV